VQQGTYKGQTNRKLGAQSQNLRPVGDDRSAAVFFT